MNLVVYTKQFKKVGLNSSIFLILYSIFRIFVECFREPDVQIGLIFGGITMGQVLSCILLVIGITIYIRIVNAKIF